MMNRTGQNKAKRGELRREREQASRAHRWAKSSNDMTREELIAEITILRGHVSVLRRSHFDLKSKFEAIKGSIRQIITLVLTENERLEILNNSNVYVGKEPDDQT